MVMSNGRQGQDERMQILLKEHHKPRVMHEQYDRVVWENFEFLRTYRRSLYTGKRWIRPVGLNSQAQKIHRWRFKSRLSHYYSYSIVIVFMQEMCPLNLRMNRGHLPHSVTKIG